MINRLFPVRGEAWKVLEKQLWEAKAHDSDWKCGVFGLNWPDPGRDVHLVAQQAANIYFDYEGLSKYAQPSVKRLEAEVMGMALEILNGPDGSACTVTLGGTESNFHAVKTVRDWARANRPKAREPEIVMPYTAHPSFNKAASYLGLRAVRVPEGAEFRADVDAMADAITDNTIMIVGSAPAYPHGKMDPIPDLAQLARSRGIWFHVDACVGGYLVPFLKKLGHELPDFDLAVPGVDSISADLHKFGYTPAGVSTFLLRDQANLDYQKFFFDDWPGGTYTVATFAGTRSATMIVAAWAVMKRLGEEGYLDIARGIVRATEMLVEGIAAIEGLELVTAPEAGIVVFTSGEFDIGAVAKGMTERGYAVSRCRKPPSIHVLIDPAEDDQLVEGYLTTLAAVVADVRAGRIEAEGVEAVYA